MKKLLLALAVLLVWIFTSAAALPYLTLRQTMSNDVATLAREIAESVGGPTNGLNAAAVSAAIESGTNNFVGTATTTNRVGYFGSSNSTATNREPYWSGSYGTGYSLIDPLGNPLVTVFPKVPDAGGYIYYFGSRTNQAMTWELASAPFDGNQPRAAFNYNDTDGSLERQWVWFTNSAAYWNTNSNAYWYWLRVSDSGAFTYSTPTNATTIQGSSIAATAGTNTINVGAAGISLAGELPFGQWLTWTNSIIMTPAQTPGVVTAVSTFNGSQFTAGSAGRMTNALAGSYRTRFKADITSDDANTTTYFFAAYTNNVIVTNSIYAHFTVATGERFSVSKELRLWLPANTWLEWRVWTFDEVTEGTSFRNTQIVFEQ
jgi:hypothetical protein